MMEKLSNWWKRQTSRTKWILGAVAVIAVLAVAGNMMGETDPEPASAGPTSPAATAVPTVEATPEPTPEATTEAADDPSKRVGTAEEITDHLLGASGVTSFQEISPDSWMSLIDVVEVDDDGTHITVRVFADGDEPALENAAEAIYLLVRCPYQGVGSVLLVNYRNDFIEDYVAWDPPPLPAGCENYGANG